MDKLTTATGKVFLTDYVVPYKGRPAMLFVRILDSDSQTVSEIFGNPEETARLEYAGIEYEGFTRLNRIFEEGNALKVVLEQNG